MKPDKFLLGYAAHLHQCFSLHGGGPPWHVISTLETSRVHAEGHSSVHAIRSYLLISNTLCLEGVDLLGRTSAL